LFEPDSRRYCDKSGPGTDVLLSSSLRPDERASTVEMLTGVFYHVGYST
jgi:hypothetical protein